MDYYQKYLKYKAKYIKIKNQKVEQILVNTIVEDKNSVISKPVVELVVE